MSTSKQSPEELREIFQRISKGASLASVAAAIFPFLEELKNQTFSELAYAQQEPLKLAHLSGKAQTIDLLFKTFSTAIEDSRIAQDEIKH